MPNERAWQAEARTFAAYLGTPRVPAEIVERYQHAIQDRRVDDTRFDRWLGRFAAAHPLLTSVGDVYARIARPYGDLRRRLTLMLALLETHGATHARYDRAAPSHPAVAWLALAASAAAWGARAIIALLILAPLHAIASLTTPQRG
ncbi:MAG: hypothetical protein ACREOG_15865 [Gemmatimonadaceae bacterium]